MYASTQMSGTTATPTLTTAADFVAAAHRMGRSTSLSSTDMVPPGLSPSHSGGGDGFVMDPRAAPRGVSGGGATPTSDTGLRTAVVQPSPSSHGSAAVRGMQTAYSAPRGRHGSGSGDFVGHDALYALRARPLPVVPSSASIPAAMPASPVAVAALAPVSAVTSVSTSTVTTVSGDDASCDATASHSLTAPSHTHGHSAGGPAVHHPDAPDTTVGEPWWLTGPTTGYPTYSTPGGAYAPAAADTELPAAMYHGMAGLSLAPPPPPPHTGAGPAMPYGQWMPPAYAASGVNPAVHAGMAPYGGPSPYHHHPLAVGADYTLMPPPAVPFTGPAAAGATSHQPTQQQQLPRGSGVGSASAATQPAMHPFSSVPPAAAAHPLHHHAETSTPPPRTSPVGSHGAAAATAAGSEHHVVISGEPLLVTGAAPSGTGSRRGGPDSRHHSSRGHHRGGAAALVAHAAATSDDAVSASTPSSGGSDNEPAPGTNVLVNYVGQMTDDILRGLCARHAKVLSCRVIMDRQTGKTRGFAFVHVASPQDADALVANLNGYRHNVGGVNKRLKVAIAVPRSHLKRASSVFFANLCEWVTASELRTVGEQFGKIIDCRVLKDNAGRSKRCGFVRFFRTEDANMAIARLNNQEVHIRDAGGSRLVSRRLRAARSRQDQYHQDQQAQRAVAHAANAAAAAAAATHAVVMTSSARAMPPPPASAAATALAHGGPDFGFAHDGMYQAVAPPPPPSLPPSHGHLGHAEAHHHHHHTQHHHAGAHGYTATSRPLM